MSTVIVNGKALCHASMCRCVARFAISRHDAHMRDPRLACPKHLAGAVQEVANLGKDTISVFVKPLGGAS